MSHTLLVARGRNSDCTVRARCLHDWWYELPSAQARFVGFPQEDSTRAFASVVTAAPLLLCDGDQTGNFIVCIAYCVDSVLPFDACPFSILAQVEAVLLGVMQLSWVCTGALDMSRSLLALEATMRTLRNRPALMGNNHEISIWKPQPVINMALGGEKRGKAPVCLHLPTRCPMRQGRHAHLLPSSFRIMSGKQEGWGTKVGVLGGSGCQILSI